MAQKAWRVLLILNQWWIIRKVIYSGKALQNHIYERSVHFHSNQNIPGSLFQILSISLKKKKKWWGEHWLTSHRGKGTGNPSYENWATWGLEEQTMRMGSPSSVSAGRSQDREQTFSGAPEGRAKKQSENSSRLQLSVMKMFPTELWFLAL